MQEAIGAVAGVKGDVIDITLLRTKVLEMGSGRSDETSWVGGRQYTGRIVSVSNKATFTTPTYNYSQFFDFVWEELRIPVPYGTHWHLAERIVLEEAQEVSATEGARGDGHDDEPVPGAEAGGRAARLRDAHRQLGRARGAVRDPGARESRTIHDRMSRAIKKRFEEAGIEIASSTMDVTVRGVPAS